MSDSVYRVAGPAWCDKAVGWFFGRGATTIRWVDPWEVPSTAMGCQDDEPQNSEDSLPSQFSFLAPFPRSTNIGERSDSYLTCAGLLSTIKHEKIKYKIINALTDLDGTDGPCIGVDSDDEAQIGHAPIINNSPTRVGYFTNLPGSSYVLRLDPGKDGFLHFNMDYPWVLASADPKANLNKEMYELIVPRALTENPNLIKRLTGFIFNLCNPKAVR
ncbi:hypothetical protein PSTG_03370 [Puccinia striiformis f. sp. tritici PST-78]|uniref:Uncharacterized protein n=1 Tax=Puccinia striiformis f. sp. tritici PST-78 TaxID=1165861 RepID=A0A0L0VVV2_9BASI|nr:hypothetical protein PSTG_03370 [Puccinia striiformis f. sp. tritici PST-78]